MEFTTMVKDGNKISLRKKKGTWIPSKIRCATRKCPGLIALFVGTDGLVYESRCQVCSETITHEGGRSINKVKRR